MRIASRGLAVPLTLLAVVALMAPLVSGQSAADKLYAGTWKANIAKSTYQPGPGPKESIRVHEDRGNGFWSITTDGINAEGQKNHGAYVYKPDGKPYPVSGMNQTVAATITLTVVDPFTVNFTQSVNGKPVATGKRTVSKDGKTMVIESKGTNASGQPVSSTVLWEKQM
jgi:hypothetical protein